jgi:hypothetical protein
MAVVVVLLLPPAAASCCCLLLLPAAVMAVVAVAVSKPAGALLNYFHTCRCLCVTNLLLLLSWRRKLKNIASYLPASCAAAIKGEGLFEGLDWLSTLLKPSGDDAQPAHGKRGAPAGCPGLSRFPSRSLLLLPHFAANLYLELT